MVLIGRARCVGYLTENSIHRLKITEIGAFVSI